MIKKKALEVNSAKDYIKMQFLVYNSSVPYRTKIRNQGSVKNAGTKFSSKQKTWWKHLPSILDRLNQSVKSRYAGELIYKGTITDFSTFGKIGECGWVDRR